VRRRADEVLVPLHRRKPSGRTDHDRVGSNAKRAPHVLRAASRAQLLEVDAVVDAGDSARSIPGSAKGGRHLIRHRDDSVGKTPESHLVERLVRCELRALPSSQGLGQAVDGSDDVGHGRPFRRQRPEHRILAAMRVHDVDRVLDQKAPEERGDPESIVAPLIDDRGLDAETAQLAGEPAVVEQHSRQDHVRLPRQEGCGSRHLNFGAGPQIGRHDLTDAHRTGRDRPLVARAMCRPPNVWRHRIDHHVRAGGWGCTPAAGAHRRPTC
jgi:hypothetical protein